MQWFWENFRMLLQIDFTDIFGVNFTLKIIAFHRQRPKHYRYHCNVTETQHELHPQGADECWENFQFFSIFTSCCYLNIRWIYCSKSRCYYVFYFPIPKLPIVEKYPIISSSPSSTQRHLLLQFQYRPNPHLPFLGWFYWYFGFHHPLRWS